MVREKAFYRTLFAVALPAALQSVISFIMGTADTVMVGQLGDAALAGVSISNQVNTFLFSLLMGIANGSAALIAQHWGKRDTATIKRVFSFVFLTCCGIGLVATVAVLLAPRGILGLMTNDQTIIEAALPYFTVISLSYVLYAATTSLAVMLRNVEVVMAALFTSTFSSALNVLLNWVFIFGKLGAPAMGVKGAAVATVLSRVCELAMLLVYALVIQKGFRLRFTDLLRPRLSVAADYLKYGLPVAIGDSQWALVGVCKAAIIGHIGTVMVSANSIADTVMNIGYISSSSLAAGACVVIGKAVGAGDYKKAREYSNTIQVIFAGMAVVMALVVYALRAPIAGLFNVSEEVGTLAVSLISIGAFTLLGTLYHAACFIGINRGAGDGPFVAKVDMVCGWLIVLPLLYLSAHVWGFSMPVVYLVSRIDQTFKWIIAYLRLRGDRWIHNVTEKAH